MSLQVRVNYGYTSRPPTIEHINHQLQTQYITFAHHFASLIWLKYFNVNKDVIYIQYQHLLGHIEIPHGLDHSIAYEPIFGTLRARNGGSVVRSQVTH